MTMLADTFSFSHAPVMRDEVVAALAPGDGGLYLDGTVGLGGHAGALLKAAGKARLCGLDRDNAALALARARLESYADRLRLFHLPFARFPEALERLGWRSLNGAMLDLGVSSMQLDNPERGFSFRADGPLDMRMDPEAGGGSAWNLVNRGSFGELKKILLEFGEEPQAGRIARRIIDARQKRPVDTTGQLAEIVLEAYPAAWRRKSRRHPATRTFQALRMSVNDELGQLRLFLEQIWQWLAPGARLAVISFHSLEDRLVKHAMRQWCAVPKDAVYGRDLRPAGGRMLSQKPILPSSREVGDNPRAASAKLRVVEKLEAGHDIA